MQFARTTWIVRRCSNANLHACNRWCLTVALHPHRRTGIKHRLVPCVRRAFSPQNWASKERMGSFKKHGYRFSPFFPSFFFLQQTLKQEYRALCCGAPYFLRVRLIHGTVLNVMSVHVSSWQRRTSVHICVGYDTKILPRQESSCCRSLWTTKAAFSVRAIVSCTIRAATLHGLCTDHAVKRPRTKRKNEKGRWFQEKHVLGYKNIWAKNWKISVCNPVIFGEGCSFPWELYLLKWAFLCLLNFSLFLVFKEVLSESSLFPTSDQKK